MAGLDSKLSTLTDELLSAGCIKFGEFTLKSGLKSPIYIDLRQIITYPKLLEQVGAAYLPLLEKLQFDRLAGLPYAAIPIATAISLAGNFPMIYPRKEVKAYGTKAEIEGEYQAGETIVVIDDLATTGGSKFEAIEKLSRCGPGCQRCGCSGGSAIWGKRVPGQSGLWHARRLDHQRDAGSLGDDEEGGGGENRGNQGVFVSVRLGAKGSNRSS